MLFILLVMMLLAQSPPADVAAAAHAAFASKCVQCHGETLSHPKAGFGLMPNLAKLAANADYIVPGHPERSEVWNQIADGDMPTDEAKAGPLTDEERNAILAWIKAGAPTEEAAAGSPPPAARETAPRVDPGSTSEPTKSPNLLLLLGRAHVVLIHFPIALLIAAAGREFHTALRRDSRPDTTVRLCVAAGAATALIAAGLGWIRALDGFPGPGANPLSLTNIHRWLGTLTAIVSVVTVALSERDVRLANRSLLTRLAILSAAALVGATGHFGGLLVHGRDYFSP